MPDFSQDFVTPCCNATDTGAYCGAVPTRWFERTDGLGEASPLCAQCAYDAVRAEHIVLADREAIDESAYEPKPAYKGGKHQFDAKNPKDPCRVCLESLRSTRHHYVVPQLTRAAHEPADAKRVCPNCEQWQRATSRGYFDCFHECALRGFAPREA